MSILSSHQTPSSPEEALLMQEAPLDLEAVKRALAGHHTVIVNTRWQRVSVNDGETLVDQRLSWYANGMAWRAYVAGKLSACLPKTGKHCKARLLVIQGM